ncbi:BON1-associated protein 2 [Rhynchospora pubera]|uniref:BON1-associated protein 2 n=1 Tax=Rhynchospora pubera TaxID=906938 RepID=A0AAV8EDY1_9POAL|nr:BON1-associated protein 2 [Rhynchospora pubera]
MYHVYIACKLLNINFSFQLNHTMPKEEEQLDDKEEKLALELTVLSAESLKSPSSILPFRLRPYVTVSSSLASLTELRTGIDESGTRNPTFNHTFHVPLSRSFFKPSCNSKNDSPSDGVHISILSKRPLLGPAEIGWCRICASDLMDGYKPPAVRRRLSYALRSPRDGCKGHGYVHVAARVVGPGVDRLEIARPKPQPQPQPGWCRVAIGIPVAGPAAEVWEQRNRGAWSDVASFGRR